MAEREPALTQRTRILARSDWHGFPPICCLAEERDGPRAQAIAAALAGMPRHGLGTRVLGALQLDGFVPGELGLFAGIARMSAEVRNAA